MEPRFAGVSALITGAGQGIGRATALAFAREGARVAVVDRVAGRAHAVAGEIRRAGGTAIAVVTDVGEEQDARAAVAEAWAELGRVDVLVNNAALKANTPFLDLPVAEWDEMVRVNLRGYFLMAQGVARAMVAAGVGGRIVNLASTAARSARAGAAHYCTTKAGIVMLTRVLALELGPHGIRVNAVAPGYVKASADEPLDGYSRAMLSLTPLGRLAETDDIADAVLFVASDGARFVSGETLYVDGAFLAGRPLPATGPERR